MGLVQGWYREGDEIKLTVVPISLREANDFVTSFHRHSGRTSRDGGKFALGAGYGDQLVGIAIVGRPLSRILGADHTTAEVLRTCVRPDAPRNVNSFLYGAAWRAWRAMGGNKLVTYTLKDESGESLRGAGWKIVGEVVPHKDGWNTPGCGRNRKWQPIYGQQKSRWEIS